MKVLLVLLLAVATLASASPVTQNITNSNNTFTLDATPNLRIINGQNAAREQFPYQVSIQQIRAINVWTHICGGSILARNYVLTAAHCVPAIPNQNHHNYRVIAGITNINDLNSQIVLVTAIITHQLFPGGAVVAPHDICLFRLATLLTWSTAVQPIPVPNPGQISSGIATVSGWGATTASGGMPATLQFADVPILDNLDCNARLNTILNSNEHPFDFESNVCTGSLVGNQSACQGDSGGPLAINGKIIGVVSWGISPCGAEATAPTVYARVANYVTWIQQNAPDMQQ